MTPRPMGGGAVPGVSVVLVPHEPRWVQDFENTAAALAKAFEPMAVHIEHVGSTAVPGLLAKPIIDVLLGARSLLDIEARQSRLQALGYRYKPQYEATLPDRRYFVLDATLNAPRVNLHAVVAGGPFWHDHLAFRNALRANAALAERYATLKRQLAERFPNDRSAYTDAKAPFVREVLAQQRR